MKVLKPFNDISIKRKFVLLALFGIVLPLTVLFSVLFSRLSSELEARMEIQLQQSTERIEKQVSNLFESINLVSYTFIADSYFNETLNHFDNQSFYDSVIVSDDIQKKIYAYTYSYSFIDSIKIYHENDSLIDISELERINYENISPVLNAFIASDDYYMLDTGEDQITFYRKLYRSTDENKNILQMSINRREFSSYLQDSFLDENDGLAYLVDTENNIIASSNYINSMDISQDIDNQKITSTRKELSTIDLISEWILQIEYKEKSIFVGREDMFLEIGMIGLFIFLIALLFAYYVSHSITKRLDLMIAAMDTSENRHPEIISLDLGSDEIGKTAKVYNHMVEENRQLINVDSLTGLKNRHSISRSIDMNIEACPNDQKLGILFLDIDNFKYINDTHGHETGDLVISETGKRLNEYSSEDIDIGRFGGDEFLICIKGLSNQGDLDTLIEKFNQSFHKPLIVEGNKYYMTVSIGIACYPKDGDNQNELVRKADQALYEAKNTGRNKYVVYDPSMGDDLEDKLQFQADIKTAFYNNEFYLEYQPYFESSTKEIKGFEALIRWKSPTRGQVSPFALICNAEEMGLIYDIGRWVFKEACTSAKKFNAISSQPLTMSINVSAVQLLDVELFPSFMNIIEAIDINPSLICLEMTETVLINSIDKGTSPFELFKEAGFKIALDDFGTGYSSLSYFKELPLSILKIDKSFVDHIVESDYDKDLVKIMVTIAHNKGVTVTAEGVENNEQFEQLLEYGCDTIQGYLLSKPLGELAVIERLSD